MGKSGQKGSGSRPRTTAIEWAVAIVSAVLVCAMLAFTFYEAVTRGSLPPLISVQVDTVVEAPGGYVVMFTASNSGDETAAGLRVSGALLRDTATVEQSDATIDYVPPRAERKAGLFFSTNPDLHRIELRPVGFSQP